MAKHSRKVPVSMVECELSVMTGDVYTLTVQLDWDVATLKEQIETELGYSCCLQVLSDDNKKLLSRDILRDVYSAQGVVDSYLRLFLTCLDVPSQLKRAEIQRAWEAFRIHSTDYGETIAPESLVGVIRYSELSASDSQVENLLLDDGPLSFVDVLSIMKTIKEASAAKAADYLVEDCFCFTELQDADDLYVVSGQYIRPRTNWQDKESAPPPRAGNLCDTRREAPSNNGGSGSASSPQTPAVEDCAAAKVSFQL
eukprot:TRINITY_DN17045_c1_g1_i1.p1 TRINITY_DN17045_c1_g1~~TRINITY_DN17045_c1_g1_i1.p1  ORF type:complete len:255 (+),score=38.97 TRINITY_DN17045_c1_g1_i1:200-964(+)